MLKSDVVMYTATRDKVAVSNICPYTKYIMLNLYTCNKIYTGPNSNIICSASAQINSGSDNIKNIEHCAKRKKC